MNFSTSVYENFVITISILAYSNAADNVYTT